MHLDSPLIALTNTLYLRLHSHVKAIKPYGAFVEIRGMSGLLHISQISFDRIEDLPSIMQLGMKLKCMIIDHDKVGDHTTRRSHVVEVLRYVCNSQVFDEQLQQRYGRLPEIGCRRKSMKH